MRDTMGKLLLLLLVGALAPLAAQVRPGLDLALEPVGLLPAGENAEYFAAGAGGSVLLGLSHLVPLVTPRLEVGSDWLPLRSKDSLVLYRAEGGLAFPIGLGAGLEVTPWLQGGYAWGQVSDGSQNAGNGLATAGLKLQWSPDPSFQLGLDAGYRWYPGLVGGATLSLSTAYSASLAGKAARVRLVDFGTVSLDNVFPVFKNYYDDHSLGSIQIRNISQEVAKDIRVTFFNKQYMDAPKECAVLDQLRPGESRVVDLFALFQDNILDVTEATKATSQISVEYRDSVDVQTLEKTATLKVYDRNAMTWDDDRKAAAFVSGKDPWVLELSNQITAAVQDSRNPGIDKNLQTAIAFHEGLRLLGLGYAVSPTSPFGKTKVDPLTVDFLKFPRQTLSYKAGDCSDLSILYASFFESVGIEAAFITVPGHILMAIKLKLTPEQIPGSLSLGSQLIVRDGAVWLPIETTLRANGFLDSWKEGAKQWKLGTTDGTAAFYPIREAWKVYQPVGLPATTEKTSLPDPVQVTTTFRRELATLVEGELGFRIAALDKARGTSTLTPKDHNDRGVVDARFGRMAAAEGEFQAALTKGDYGPSLVNLGNLSLLGQDYPAAEVYYQRALKTSPDNPKYLVNLAKVQAQTNQLDKASTTLAAVRKADPKLADQYSYLAVHEDSGGRAAEQGLTVGDLLWN
ncbi:MAG: tetratricopeptide repeat protein [Spirochaetales bacterium]